LADCEKQSDRPKYVSRCIGNSKPAIADPSSLKYHEIGGRVLGLVFTGYPHHA
jgi:hypothetical protein